MMGWADDQKSPAAVAWGFFCGDLAQISATSRLFGASWLMGDN
jgi:hypothetical protein